MKNRSKRNFWILLGAVPFNFMVYSGGRAVAENAMHFNLTTPIDNIIPLLSWTALIYWGLALPFWIINYCLCTLYDKKGGLRFIFSHYLGEIVCFIIFVLFPTTMIRPEIEISTFSDRLLMLVYYFDKPDNLMPSIHCFVSWLCWIGVRKNRLFTRWYRIFSFLAAIAICISTMTVKQHVIADVVVGILLAELSYYIAGYMKHTFILRSKISDSDR